MIGLIDRHPYMGVTSSKVICRSVARLVPGKIRIVVKMVRMLGYSFVN